MYERYRNTSKSRSYRNSQACLDLVYNSTDPGKDKLIKRIESLHGVHTIEAAAELGFGTREYELINLQEGE